ncbi:Type I secretion system ATP-binding protein PrsD [Pannonibacter phragmitetus]|uniref:Type I secretion system ATP-binding protein PrsD n=2 Tax=Pannonibacter phragmitetus TaxID=121719 RepID=A0A378ZQ07_9HYPH|nr:Type I secretion system ATP-binding protein PrsD [Pannonibacter phragmitetus]
MFVVGLISFVINLLMFTSPLYMLQIYDRVLASGSLPTLIVLSVFAVTLYLVYGILEGGRGRVLARLAQRIDAQVSGLVFKVSTLLPVYMGPKGARLRPVQDLDAIRQFLAGQGPTAIFDLPWMPVYLGVLFLFHPLLGGLAVGGAAVILILIGMNEAASKGPSAEAARSAARRAFTVESSRRNAEVIKAMAMTKQLAARWDTENARYLSTQRRASDWSGLFGTAIKTFRFILQSAVLGLGAYLAIEQEITPGVMIAASIMMSRALSPVEVAVGQWRGFVAARQGYGRLCNVLNALPAQAAVMDLPLPRSFLKVEAISCAPVGVARPILHGISFTLSAGDGLGIIGPSGSGKSVLARALTGAIPVQRGAVRLDGAELAQWPEDMHGRIIGYLPQDVQLFDGTVAENIARFSSEADSAAVIEAAQLASLHEFITGLPEGYNTLIGTEGEQLSGGQLQRLGLARALYGNPFLIVLDEPNSNLDGAGETSLTQAIRAMRQKGSIVIIIAHRPSAVAAVEQILMLRDGQMAGFGPKDEVLRSLVTPVVQTGVA